MNIISSYKWYFIQAPVVSIVFIWVCDVFWQWFQNESELGCCNFEKQNSYESYFMLLVFVLSTSIALYQWYYIGIAVVVAVLYEFVLTQGHGFLNQSLTLTIGRKRINMKVFYAFLQLFLQLWPYHTSGISFKSQSYKKFNVLTVGNVSLNQTLIVLIFMSRIPIKAILYILHLFYRLPSLNPSVISRRYHWYQ